MDKYTEIINALISAGFTRNKARLSIRQAVITNTVYGKNGIGVIVNPNSCMLDIFDIEGGSINIVIGWSVIKDLLLSFNTIEEFCTKFERIKLKHTLDKM